MAACSWTARSAGATALLAAFLLTGCSSPTPTAPTTPPNANVAGVWVDSTGAYRWTLVQSGTTVSGTGTGAHPLGVPITSTVTGSVAGPFFTFSEEQSWSVNGQTQVSLLHADEMRVDGGSMTGIVTSQPLFPPYRAINGSLTMVRVGQAP